MRSPNSLKLLFLAGTALASPALAQELPTGASVGAGVVDISTPTAGAMAIQQSTQSAIVNWQSFSVGAGGVVTFTQPNGQAVILNRVTGSATTSIAGQINANGQVFIVNPNGIAITSSGVVNAGGFVASTLGISDSDFLNGNYAFSGNGTSGRVSNAGRIEIGSGGYAALLGGRVDNSGLISAPLGKVGLGAGEQATLDLSGDGFLQVAIPSQDGGNDALISSSGTISADGGRIVISAAAAQDAARHVINLSGVTEARSVSGHSGAVILGGSGGAVRVSGKIDVSARTAAQPAAGGSVTITGADIGLEGATIDASGLNGGGQVRIGGDYYGQGILPTAATLSVDDASIIYADALDQGDGGGVVLWSDELTSFAGNISAKGAGTGKGGFVEVSGKHVLDYRGFADLRAPSGNWGKLLLDPLEITIQPGSPPSIPATPPFVYSSYIYEDVLESQLAAADVTISTGALFPGQGGDIYVDAALDWLSGSRLTLDAANDILVRQDITAPNGGVTLLAGRDIVFDLTPTRSVSVGTPGLIATAGRNLDATGTTGSQILINSLGQVNVTAANLGNGDLIPEDFLVQITSVGDTNFTTTGGPLAINAGSSITSTAGNVIVRAPSFLNFGGPGAISTPAGRFLIYSADYDPAAFQAGGLTGNNLYGPVFSNPATPTPGPGNYFIFTRQPTLTLTAADFNRLYLQAASGIPAPAVAGLVNGDSLLYALGTAPFVTDTTPLAAPPGSYAGALQVLGATSPTGYQVVVVPGNLTVTPSGNAPVDLPPPASQVPMRAIPPNAFALDNAVPDFVGLNNGRPGGVRVVRTAQQVNGSPEATRQSARQSLQFLQSRSDDFTKALGECQVSLDEKKDTSAFIDCASNALESYGNDLENPAIKLPPALQGTVTQIRRTVQRLRTANTLTDKKAALAEAQAAVHDLVDFVRNQTKLVSAVDPETEALLVQHGQVMGAALEKLDLAMVSAVEI